MIARVLPIEQWPRLIGTEAEKIWPHLDPENARVLVVEDGDAIVATWTIMRVVHAECLWIAPEYRGAFGVAKRLLKGMREIATGWGASKVITGSVSEHVTELIYRLGGVPIPAMSFVLPVGRSRIADLEIGRCFHRQLAEQIEEPQHEDDDQHDEQVGRALRTAIEGGEPVRAMKDYNAWAVTAGYESIRYLGTVNGRVRADIVTAVVDVDEQYGVRVVEQEEACRT